MRCGTADSLGEVNRSHTRRSLQIRRDRERGTMTITVDLPMETGELLEKALDRARDSTASQTPELADECWAVQQADAVVIVENEQGEPLSVGRKTRTVPTAIKRALRARDKGCSFPGCHHTRFVDAHHIKHWSAGGETQFI